MHGTNNNKEYLNRYLQVKKFWRNHFYNLLVSSITWEGQPFYPQYNVPEQFLVEQGQCIAFVDDVLGFMILPCRGSQSLNAVGQPAEYMAYSYNGATYHNLVPGVNAVYIGNNPRYAPDTLMLSNYAERMATRQLTQEINLNSQKTPVLVKTTKNMELTARNLLSKYQMGATEVIADKGAMEDITLDSIRLNAPFIVPELSLEMRSVYNEFLTFIGIPSMDITKNERMLKDEVAQSMGGAIAARAYRMTQRKIGARQVKNLFGIGMEPKYNIDIQPIPDFTPGGGNDGQVHNDAGGDDA